MRPTKLIMSAFGPYSNKVEIDFDKLGENGLYLITGDTGAGKTTIFDAITYALYGRASGENRDASMFRSKYALESTPTSVALSFTYSGKDYYIKRNPEYVRPKSRGDGFTTQKASAELYLPNGKTIDKPKEVNDAVIDILGVDYHQFTQIVMIAQGDFLKLLNSSTDERKQIFQKLFKTQKYNLLQEKIKEDFLEINKKYNSLKSTIMQYIDGIKCEEDENLYLTIEKIKNDEAPFIDVIPLIKDNINNSEEEEKKCQSELDKIDGEIEEITKILTKAKTLMDAKKSIKKSEQDLLKKEEEKNKLSLKVEEAKKEYDKRDDILNEITQIEIKLDDYDELEKNINEEENIRNRIDDNDKLFNKKSLSKDKLEEDIKNIEEEIRSIDEIIKNKSKYIEKKSKLEEEKKDIDTIINDKENFDKTKETYENLLKDYKIKSEKARALKEKYDKGNRAYLDEQAGILAKNLIENEPCPVCGSTSHPNPAKQEFNAPTKEELEKLKSEFEKAQEEERKASEKAGEVKGSLKEIEERLNKLSNDILNGKSLEEKKDDVDNLLNEVLDKISDIEDKETTKEKLNQSLQKNKDNLTKLKDEIQNIINSKLTDETMLKNISQRIDNLKGNLKYENKNHALKTKKSLEQTKKSIEENYKETNEAFEDCKRSIDEIKIKIDTNKEIIKNSEDVDITKEEEKQTYLKTEKQNLQNKQKNINLTKEINSSYLEKIQSKLKEQEKVEEKYKWLNALSSTANGTLTGKEKIMLETYIQMAYFDRIINRANIRLISMTSGQYELIRKTSADNKRKQSGLELDVIDHYNGSKRDVKSLSGGESFKASLCLALGLCDEIQSSAGGIKLDTMFVDEGFGSLDEESLSQAIRTLSSLCEGNRLVGIISHVSELREKIDKQIIVKKEKTGGSKVIVEV
ncbi:AAA family ATPase [Anaerofustis sp. NSJ-163]|uniref:AAA family ATPase n=1 Tax=Anaerofustis sp. NSJ-163 TaxID=2944391 RepID=UPI00209C1DBA|nr:SMC family ATPase [Anaerofustis sp. NSJ-163]MCO8194769.1 SMC family ATPase [Anaerofustis sp. NSJ-163]